MSAVSDFRQFLESRILDHKAELQKEESPMLQGFLDGRISAFESILENYMEALEGEE